MDPEVLAELEAIDATLRGDAVDPAHAELAELALLLAADRPQMPPDAARSLDDAVARRFAPAPAGDGSGISQRPRRTRWALRPSFGVALAGVAAVAIAGVIVVQGQNGSSPLSPGGPATGAPALRENASGGASSAGGASSTGTASSGSTAAQTHSSASSAAPPATTPGPVTPNPTVKAAPGAAAQNLMSAVHGAPTGASAPRDTASGSAGSGGSASGPAMFGAANGVASTQAPVPAPTPNGRKVIQSAQLQLVAPGAKIDTVSQELFSVVGDEHGVVKSSTITAASGNNGYAVFQLSIPSNNLADTMTRLSSLRYAHVASRTDATQDVNGRYLSIVRGLKDAQTLRTSLLKQLAKATTQIQIVSIKAQLNDAEATIARYEAALRNINYKVNYSTLSVQINAGAVPILHPASSSSGGFTLGKAAHDALRVLTVAAGVALITLAVLVPLGLFVAVVVWIGYWIRRRRREAALDSA
jgi:hypothetical protein